MPRTLPGDTAPPNDNNDPLDQVGGAVGAAVQAAATPAISQAATSVGSAVSYAGTLAAAEASSYGTLPHGLVYSAALAASDDKEASTWAALIARELDLTPPPAQESKRGKSQVQEIVDKYTGESITLARANQLFSLGQNLGTLLTEGVSLGPRSRGYVDPQSIYNFVTAMNPMNSVAADFALQSAIDMTRRGVDQQKFAANLASIAKWNQDTDTVSPEQAVVMARFWSERHDSTITPGNIVNLIDPAIAEAIEARSSYHPQGAPNPYAQQALIADPGTLAALQASYARTLENPNYLRDAQRILQHAEAPTWVDRAVLGALDKMFYAGQRLFIELEGVVRPAVYGIIDAAPGGQSISDGFREAQAIRSSQIQRLNQGVSVGEQYVEDGVLPPHTGAGFDFLIGWAADPFILSGKISQGLEASRSAPTLLASTTGRAVANRFFPNATGALDRIRSFNFGGASIALSRSSESRALYERVFASTDDMFRYADRLRAELGARQALDPEYLSLARERMLARFSRPSEEAWAEWQNVMRSHFGIQPPPGSVAQEVVNLREGLTAETRNATLTVPQQLTLDDFVRAELPAPPLLADDVIARNAVAPILRNEVPHRIFPLGRRNAQLAFAESRLGNTAVGRAWRTLANVDPGPIFRPSSPEAATWIVRRGTRWRTFSEPELRAFQVEAEAIRSSGVSVERRLVALAEDMEQQGQRAVLLRIGVPEDMADDALADITRTSRGMRPTQSFGELTIEGRGRLTLDRPLLETQLEDAVTFMDPILFRTMARRYVGSYRELARSMVNRLGASMTPEAAAALTARPLHWLDQGREGLRAIQRFWKFTVVPRPAYIPRVILGDENVRFMTTTSSVMDRFAAQRLEFLPDALKTKLDDFFAEDVGGITIPRPGTYNYEPLAAMTFRTEELLDDLLRREALSEGTVKSFGSFGLVRAGDKQHGLVWERVLNLQFGGSVPGRIAMRSVANGDTMAQTARNLEAWARTDGFNILQTRIGRSAAEVQQWSEDLAELAHTYTLGRVELAEASIAKSVDAALLDTIDDALKPAVHGPLMMELTGADTSPLKTFGDAAYRRLVRTPEDVLNRQPFYKLWKSRAERSQAQFLETQGIEITDEVRAAMDVTSREYALAQTKAIMFDFTENSRFGELMSMFVPFYQPWVEAFGAYSRVLRRNPALIGYVRNVFQTGLDSGMIRKDENGQYVMPWTAVARAASWLPWVGGEVPDGMSVVAPLSSFSMFWSQSVDVGGIPIPAPSVAPWWQYGAQQFLKNTDNPYLHSYFFAYGPNTPLVSSWLERAARAVAPERFNDQRDVSRAQDMLRLYQYLGTDVDENGNKLPFSELKARALQDARNINAVLAVTGFIAPTAGRITFPEGYEAAEAELEQLRDSLGFEAGTDRFLQKHPDLTLLTVGKTFYDATLDGIEGPRVPASDQVQKLLNQPGFSDFAKNEPWAAAALILSMDDQWDEGSLSAFSRQVADGQIKYKGLDRFLREGEQPGFWNAIDAVNAWYYPLKDKFEAQGLGDDNAAVQDLAQRRAEALYDVYLQYPHYAKAQGHQAHPRRCRRPLGAGVVERLAGTPVADRPGQAPRDQRVRGLRAVPRHAGTQGVLPRARPHRRPDERGGYRRHHLIHRAGAGPDGGVEHRARLHQVRVPRGRGVHRQVPRQRPHEHPQRRAHARAPGRAGAAVQAVRHPLGEHP